MNSLRIFICLVLSICTDLEADDYISKLPSDRLEKVDILWAPSSQLPPTLLDIASRLPSDTDAKDTDLVTYAHEGSHFLCICKSDRHGLYVLGGLRVYLDIPNLSMLELFSSIPHEDRGEIYTTYQKQGSHPFWSNRTTMVLDEWLAYTHGSMTRRELAMDQRSETDRYCATMATYCWYLLQILNRKGYDTDDIQEFCTWNNHRCSIAIDHWDVLFTKKFR